MEYTSNHSKRQEQLFDIAPQLHAETVGASHVMFSTAAEYIACKTLGLDSIKINGTFAVNFDAECNGVFYEIKSVRRSGGKITCYDWRMKKEREFPNLMYCIVIHNVTDGSSGIVEKMASTCQLLLCPAYVIHNMAKELPLRIHREIVGSIKRNGYTRKGYKDGYRNLPIGSLLSLVKMKAVISVEIAGAMQRIPVSII